MNKVQLVDEVARLLNKLGIKWELDSSGFYLPESDVLIQITQRKEVQ